MDTTGVTPDLKLCRPSQIQSDRACDTGASAASNTSKLSYLQLVSNTRVVEERALPAPVQDASAVPDVAQSENAALVADHYVVRPMQSHETPDTSRAHFDEALLSLSL